MSDKSHSQYSRTRAKRSFELLRNDDQVRDDEFRDALTAGREVGA